MTGAGCVPLIWFSYFRKSSLMPILKLFMLLKTVADNWDLQWTLQRKFPSAWPSSLEPADNGGRRIADYNTIRLFKLERKRRKV
jgi:hypothetical protein